MAERLLFGRFALHASTGELTRDGELVHLQLKPARVLALLASRTGELVTREEIHAAVWGDEKFLEFDQALNFAIKHIRTALGDHADRPEFIETLPRRGYRFVAAVRRTTRRPARAGSFRRRRAAAAVAALLAAGVTALVVAGRRPQGSSTRPEEGLSRLTSLLGTELHPSLSPDGSRVAFVWRGLERQDRDIYLGEIDPNSRQLVPPPDRLTDDAEAECCPRWSPDARRIAYVRLDAKGASIRIAPARGGPVRELTRIDPWFGTGLSWSADGERLVFSDRRAGDARYALYQITMDAMEIERLTAPPADAIGDAFPALSPDGADLAFARIAGRGDLLERSDIYVLPATGGELRRLTTDAAFIGAVDWHLEPPAIVFASDRGGGSVALWRIQVSGGDPVRLEGPLIAWTLSDGPAVSIHQVDGPFRIGAARRAGRLVYAAARYDANIYHLELRGTAFLAGVPSPLSSTRADSGPHFSPDGHRVVFNSKRSGASEVWMCDSDGSGCSQLTDLRVHSGSPRWSPDGGQIAFDTRVAGNADIYLVHPETRVFRSLTGDPANDVVPSWSHEGRWVYFSSNRSGRHEIWKIPSSGGEAIRVTEHEGFAARESSDGEWLYYSKVASRGLWRRPTAGGDEHRVLRNLECWGYWDLVEDGIYFVEKSRAGIPRLRLLTFSTDEVTTVVALDHAPACGDGGLSVAPDGQSLLVTQLELAESDLMLTEHSSR